MNTIFEALTTTVEWIWATTGWWAVGAFATALAVVVVLERKRR